jgi:SAM-dependent methyltransferase
MPAMTVPQQSDPRFDWRQLARTVRNTARRLRMSAARREVSESFWRRRSGGDWVETYWNAHRTPRRDGIIDAVRSTFGAPTSVLDVGCNAGPTLRRIAAEFPGCRLAGFDINAEAIAGARQRLTEIGAAAELSVGSFYEVLPGTPPGSADVVVSSFALAYVPPAHLPGVLADIVRIAGRGVVLAEPHAFEPGRSAGVLTVPWHDWRHDYRSALVGLGIDRERMTLSDLPEPGSTESGLLVVDLR